MNQRLISLLFVAIVIAVLFAYSSALQNDFYKIVNFFNGLVLENEPLALLVFVLLSLGAALISPLTNIPLVPFAVVIWGAVPTTALLLIGWLLGDVVAYGIGRQFGHRGISYFIGAERLDEWSHAVKKHTNFYRALFLRLILPAELGYAFGIIKYPFRSYVIITFIAELPFAIVSTYASEAIIAGDITKFVVLFGALCVLVFSAVKMLRRKQLGV